MGPVAAVCDWCFVVVVSDVVVVDELVVVELVVDDVLEEFVRESAPVAPVTPAAAAAVVVVELVVDDELDEFVVPSAELGAAGAGLYISSSMPLGP